MLWDHTFTYTNPDGKTIEFDSAERTISDSAYDALFTMRYTWNCGANVFGKVGVAYTDTHFIQTPFPDPRQPELLGLYVTDTRFYNFLPELTFGVGWEFFNRVNVYGSFTHIHGYSNTWGGNLTGEVYNEQNVLLPAKKPADL